jgi:glucosamine--fructose-6-phosphate aminotransferase (isomerizing)
MCGIFGCLRNKNSSKEIVKDILIAINLLKNRGYDSCGVYLNDKTKEYLIKIGIDGEIIKNSDEQDIFKLLDNNIDKLDNKEKYNIGISHTRWATHGGKTDENSHPHLSNDNNIVLVHNGIISNYDILKKKYLEDYTFYSHTDTEVIVNLISYLKNKNPDINFLNILKMTEELLEGTWACIIYNTSEIDKLYFMKNENPLLIAKNDEMLMMTSEPSGFLNTIDKYILLRDKTIGYLESNGNIVIKGEWSELLLIKTNNNEIKLDNKYDHWMRKEIDDQVNIDVLLDPVTKLLRYNDNNVLFNMEFIKDCKYLYIIACGSSYYAGLIASNYFRFTNAFEFVNVFDGSEFNKSHLESIVNPEEDLLILIISQSGETRDLDIATSICRDFSSNRKNILKVNPNILDNNDPKLSLFDNKKTFMNNNNLNLNKGEIKIIGIINVIDSLISRRMMGNIYTNSGRENAVAATKSCTSQILSCLLLAIYKSQLNYKLEISLKNKFFYDLNILKININEVLQLENKIKSVAFNINSILNETNNNSLFVLGKDELHGAALEGSLKIKEISYIHAEAHHIAGFKHGVYALVHNKIPVIILYKKRNHFIKSVIEEIKTRDATVIEISNDAIENENNIIIPNNKTFTGILSVITMQLLSYHLSILRGINPDRPRNLAKTCTTD